VVGRAQLADGDRACVVGGGGHAGIVPEAINERSGRRAVLAMWLPDPEVFEEPIGV
jgi:hypothetical protein